MDKHLKILILEDSQDDVDLIERELKKGGFVFTSTIVKKKETFEKALREFLPDIILCDHSLPEFNSIEALKSYKEYQKESRLLVPFILITGSVSEEFAVQCIKAGADDYILKDRLKRLPASIHSALEKCRIDRERMAFLDEIISSEALMKEAEHLAHFGGWEVDLVSGKKKWSDEAYRIFGYEPGEVEASYETFLMHVHPDDVTSLKSAIDEAMACLNTHESEFKILDKQGNLKYVHSKIVIERNDIGEAIKLIGFNLDITERKKAEMRVQKSEQEYKSLFDQNPDAVYSLDLEGNFTNVNNGLAALAGKSVDELLCLNFKQFLTDEDADRVQQHFLAATKGRPQRYEGKFFNARGKVLVLDVTNMPIVVHGEIVGVHGVAKDITRRKELEGLVSQVHRLARIGAWEIDFTERKVGWTAITKELHEVDPDFEADIETSIQFYKEGESRSSISNAINQGMKQGTPWDLELQIITARGNERWIRSIGEAECKNGKCIRLYGSIQDIHVRKQAEETLIEAYREKVTILESIGDAFFAVDKEWIVTYWNNVAETKLSMPREKIVGKNLWAVFSDAVTLPSYTEYHRAMTENTAVHFKDYYPKLDIWFEISAYPSPVGLSVYFKDISELKKYTQAIEDQNTRLKEIAWIQSHKVRAPLARMMGLINLIKIYKDIDLSQTEILDLIVDSAHELDGLIRGIVRKTEEIENNEITR